MITLGKFEILAELGHGAMGTVYRARDPILDRQVALKTISAQLLSRGDALMRFQREARAAARLQHPNIVTIYEQGEVDGSLYIAMELLEGIDLAAAMAPGQLTLEQKLRIAVEVCRGLDYAHKRGVVHRDVKPANIRILPDCHVKLVDFGIAHMMDSSVTQTGIVLGTPSYIAPEVLKSGRVDHRADIWAVGVILYEMVSGKRPYDAPTVPGLIYKIVHEPHPPLATAAQGLAPPLLGVVDKALAKVPAERFQEMAHMASALEVVLGVASGESALSAEGHEQAYLRNVEEARRLLARNDLERALEAARRAQALEPSRTGILALIDQIEDRLRDAPTLVGQKLGPTVNLTMTPVGEATPPSPLRVPTPPGLQSLGTSVLQDLRTRGATVFRDMGLFGEPPAAKAVALSPILDHLAISGTDGAIRIWDLGSRTRLFTLRSELHLRSGHDALGAALAFSPDGTLLASGHVDGAVHLWDMGRGQEIPVKLRHDASVGALAFSPDGSTLATGGHDANLKLWDVRAAREARRELHRQPAGVTAVCYVAGGATVVTGHANKILRLQDTRTGRLTATLRGPEALVNVVCLAPDGRRLAVGSQDRTIRLFDLESRSQLFVVGAHRRPPVSLCFLPDGASLASVALENAVNLWDLETQAPLAALWGPGDESFAGVALLSGGDHIAVALADGRIRVWGPAQA